MERKYNEKLVPLARELRKNMTEEERHLWYDFLRNYPVRFARQKIIGKYIADFYCAKAKLVIELDGSQHFDETKLLKDKERDEFLKQYNLKILRIPNNEIKENFSGVCDYIDSLVREAYPLRQLR